jgi:hypothetical protein
MTSSSPTSSSTSAAAHETDIGREPAALLVDAYEG